jgi:uncharacterized YigZ family protein
MTVFSYRTIELPCEGSFKEKGSKFLAFAYPVENEQQIREIHEKLKKEFFDARHHCFGYILGADKKKFRAFDDGEPNHSAGDPILGQIRSKNLTDVLIVVVRYFGGVKLGVGGLISAYKTAAEEALANAKIIEKDVIETITLQYDYTATPDVMRLVKEFDLVIKRQAFNESCVLEAEVRLRDHVRLIEKLSLMKVMGMQIDRL